MLWQKPYPFNFTSIVTMISHNDGIDLKSLKLNWWEPEFVTVTGEYQNVNCQLISVCFACQGSFMWKQRQQTGPLNLPNLPPFFISCTPVINTYFGTHQIQISIGNTLARGGGNGETKKLISQESQQIWRFAGETTGNQLLADHHTLTWQRLAPKHLWARLTRTLSNSGVKQSRQALPGWANSSRKRRRRTSFSELSERTEVWYCQIRQVGIKENQNEIRL